MSKKVKNTLILIFLILLIIGFVLFTFLSGRVTMNPPGTIGNTAGNLNNSGLFCEYDGTVYFSNSFDNGTMYAMDASEGNMRKLTDTRSLNILAGGKYLYYSQLGTSGVAGLGNTSSIHSFNRCRLNGKDSQSLSRDVIVSGQLVDNYLYLLAANQPTPGFYKIKIDKSETIKLADYQIYPTCAVNGSIYYSGTQDNHFLYRLNTSNDSTSLVWEGNLWNPIIYGDYVYYMDLDNNYCLSRYSLTQNVVEILTHDRVDCFNVGNGYIYYQKSSQTEPQLIAMAPDGSNPVVIASGIYCNINMTSQYVYFQPYGDESTTYHMPIGGTQYSIFDAAKQVAAENQ